MISQGRHEAVCERIRKDLKANGVILIVLGDEKLSGVTYQFENDAMAAALPGILRQMAANVEASGIPVVAVNGSEPSETKTETKPESPKGKRKKGK